jgi:hypothetical protein
MLDSAQDDTSLTLAGLIVLLALAFTLLGALLYAFWRLQKGLKMRDAELAEAELRFERELLSQMGVAPPAPPPLRPTFTASEALPAPLPFSPAPEAAPPGGVAASPPASASTSAERLQDLAQRLMALRIIEEFQGRLALPTPPEGLIHRLRWRGAALLLPRVEHGDHLAQLTRRFEMVFCLTDSDEVVVVERLQTRIPTLIDMETRRPGAD